MITEPIVDTKEYERKLNEQRERAREIQNTILPDNGEFDPFNISFLDHGSALEFLTSKPVEPERWTINPQRERITIGIPILKF